MSYEEVFRKVARGDTLSRRDQRQLIKAGRLLDGVGGQQQGWGSPAQSAPHFDFLRFREAEGEVLPHECAMLYMGSNGGPTQTIPTGSFTTVVNYDDPYTVAPENTASYAHGLKVDASAGRIYVSGIPNGTVVDIFFSVFFAADANGTRQVKWKADDGSTRTIVRNPISGVDKTYMHFFHAREIPSGETWYEMDVAHFAGHDLDIDNALFHVARKR